MQCNNFRLCNFGLDICNFTLFSKGATQEFKPNIERTSGVVGKRCSIFKQQLRVQYEPGQLCNTLDMGLQLVLVSVDLKRVSKLWGKLIVTIEHNTKQMIETLRVSQSQY